MACSCTTGNQNSGARKCSEPFGLITKDIFMPLFAADGTENKIPIAEFNSMGLTAIINDVDPSKRIYPWPLTRNYEAVKADPVSQEFNGGEQIIVRENPRIITHMIPQTNHILVGQVNSFRCFENGVFYVSQTGAVRVRRKPEDPDNYYPIPLGNQTVHSQTIVADGSNVEMVQVKYNEEINFNEAEYFDIHTPLLDFDAKRLNGLFDAVVTFDGAITTTGFTIDVRNTYYDPITMLDDPDFTLTEEDGTPITITGVTESSLVAGRYVFVTAAMTSADTNILTLNKTGIANNVTPVVVP